MPKILLLEDDPNLGLIVQEHLQLNGYEVTLTVNGEDGLSAFNKDKYDLCLIDVMMPKMDGFSFAQQVRQKDIKNGDTPFIFLTAKSLKEDKIKGFQLGCDDYITKPFSVEELLLRIQAVLKRTGGTINKQSQIFFELGDFIFDSNKQTLKNKNNQYNLTSKEAELLKLLCLNQNNILERGAALKQIWGSESYFDGRSMDVFISKLRKYLKDDDRIEIINIHGKGFKLIVSE
ncbi:MAG: response regulator transcription factor [candidate division Zixibacteria bacterium]|nr:response regulator transcription factor [candidate division Zixibacteria bacterium]